MPSFLVTLFEIWELKFKIVSAILKAHTSSPILFTLRIVTGKLFAL